MTCKRAIREQGHLGILEYEVSQRLFERVHKMSESYFGNRMVSLSELLFSNHKQLITGLKEGLNSSGVMGKSDFIAILEGLESWVSAFYGWFGVYKYRLETGVSSKDVLDSDDYISSLQQSQFKMVCPCLSRIKAALEKAKTVLSSGFAIYPYSLSTRKPLSSNAVKLKQESLAPLEAQRSDLVDLIDCTLDFIRDVHLMSNIDSIPINSIFLFKRSSNGYSKNYYELMLWLNASWNRVGILGIEALSIGNFINILNGDDSSLDDRLKAIHHLNEGRCDLQRFLVEHLEKALNSVTGLKNGEIEPLNSLALAHSSELQYEGVTNIILHETNMLLVDGEGNCSLYITGLMRFLLLLEIWNFSLLYIKDIPKGLNADVRQFLIQIYLTLNKTADITPEDIEELKSECYELFEKMQMNDISVDDSAKLIPLFRSYSILSQVSAELQNHYERFLEIFSKKTTSSADLERLHTWLSDEDLLQKLLLAEMLPKCFLEIFPGSERTTPEKTTGFMEQLEALIRAHKILEGVSVVEEKEDCGCVEDREAVLVSEAAGAASGDLLGSVSVKTGLCEASTRLPNSSVLSSSVLIPSVPCPPLSSFLENAHESIDRPLQAKEETPCFSEVISDSGLASLSQKTSGVVVDKTSSGHAVIAAVGGRDFDKAESAELTSEGSTTASEVEAYLQIIEQERARSLAKEHGRKNEVLLKAEGKSKVKIVDSVDWDLSSLTRDLKTRKGLQMWLNRAGFEFQREGGRHTVFSSVKGETFAVPRHGNAISAGVAQQAKRAVLESKPFEEQGFRDQSSELKK